MIAALYVDPRGPYPRMPDVDAWDEARDARLYAGPHAIVAHPPCGPWGKLRHMYRGNEHDCALYAVEQVRKWGGVLEHPAQSLLFAQSAPGHSLHGWGDLPLPGCTDPYGGYTIEVAQVEWGHVARKRTWLYCVRVPRSALETSPYPGREPTHWCSGGRDYPGRKHRGTAAPPGIKCASAQQRRRTPPLFAEYLVRLARSVRP